ncbi:unnamed protein product [Pleuronectes platessa]|uniref:Uncharacterized protein n=1 Tax=Pleuronectes platessa TaxID=8262 RepID=A0A9N7VHS4_PLEPL|nr:unnamed protein product [Pleuronectes platessa]
MCEDAAAMAELSASGDDNKPSPPHPYDLVLKPGSLQSNSSQQASIAVQCVSVLLTLFPSHSLSASSSSSSSSSSVEPTLNHIAITERSDKEVELNHRCVNETDQQPPFSCPICGGCV